MAMLVWAMMGIALWHFTVFVPDRFWGGIVGAFLGALFGAILIGLAVNGFTIPGQDDTTLVSALEAVPGALAGIAVVYFVGVRRGNEAGLAGAQDRARGLERGAALAQRVAHRGELARVGRAHPGDRGAVVRLAGPQVVGPRGDGGAAGRRRLARLFELDGQRVDLSQQVIAARAEARPPEPALPR